MRRTSLALVSLVSLSLAFAGCATAPHPDSSGWEDLFNRDLSNAEFPAGGWHYAPDGWLVPTQGEPIFTKKDYKSVVLDLVYVLPPDANSGIFFYDSDHPKKKFEVQLLDDRSPVFKDVKPYQNTGSVYGRCAPSELRSRPAGEENRMTVWCEDGHIRVYLNGGKVIDLEMDDYTDPVFNPDGTKIPWYMDGYPSLASIPHHGRIALQGIHNTTVPVRFKYVKIKEL